MATPAHYVRVYDGAWTLDHPVTCEPAECPYVESVTDEVVGKKTKDPEPGSVNVYKVTGTDAPKFALDKDESGEEPTSEGDTSNAVETAYDIIEDRDAYEDALAAAQPPKHPKGEKRGPGLTYGDMERISEQRLKAQGK